MFKKITKILIVFMMVVSFPAITSADILIYVNGEVVYFAGQEPINVDGRTLVPVREVFEKMGFVVNWSEEAAIATITREGDLVIIPANQGSFIVNGRDIVPDVPAQLVEGRLLLPLRAVAEALGFEVYWDYTGAVHLQPPAAKGDIPTYEETDIEPAYEPTMPPAPFFAGMPLPNRPLTPSEQQLWRNHYTQIGGATRFELEVVELINYERAYVDLQPLVINRGLMMAARFRAQEMYDLNYFGHVSPVYGASHEIFRLFVAGGTLGESVFLGAVSPDEVVEAWMSSPVTRADLLSPAFREIGVGERELRWVNVMSTGTTAVPPQAHIPFIPTTPAPALSSAALEAFEAHIWMSVNQEREASGLEPLALSYTLRTAARQQARATQDSNPAAIARNLGFTGSITNNSADGFEFPSAAMNYWMNCDESRANILDRRATQMGVGLYTRDDGQIRWVQLFSPQPVAPTIDSTSPGHIPAGFVIGAELAPTAEFRSARRIISDGQSVWHVFPSGANPYANFTLVRTENNIIRFVYSAANNIKIGDQGTVADTTAYLELFYELTRLQLHRMGLSTTDRRHAFANSAMLVYLTRSMDLPVYMAAESLAYVLNHPLIDDLIIFESSGDLFEDLQYLIENHRIILENMSHVTVGLASQGGRIGILLTRQW